MQRSERTRKTIGSRSEAYSISSANSQTSNDASYTEEERRILSAEKRFETLKDKIARSAPSIAPKTTIASRLKSMFTNRAKVIPVPENTAASFKKTKIKDKDCASMRDFIMHERIPKKYAVYVDKQCYDARSLLRWLDQNIERRLPHTNLPVTADTYQKVHQKVHPASETSLEIIQPSKQLFRRQSPMYRTSISEDGNYIAFENFEHFLNNKIEVWDIRTKTKKATLDILNGRLYWLEWDKNGRELKALVQTTGAESSRLIRTRYKVWDTYSWQPITTPLEQMVSSRAQSKHIIQGKFLGIFYKSQGQTSVYEVWDTEQAQRIMHGETNTPLFNMAMNPTGTRLAMDMGDKVQIMDVSTGNMIKEFVVDGGVGGLSWNCKGNKLAIQQVSFHHQTRKGTTIIMVIHADTGRKEFESRVSLYPTILWHPTKERIFAVLHADRKQMIDIFNVSARSAKIKRIIVDAITTSTWSNQIQWIRNGATLALCQQFKIYQWDMTEVVSGGGKKRVRTRPYANAKKMN